MLQCIQNKEITGIAFQNRCEFDLKDSTGHLWRDTTWATKVVLKKSRIAIWVKQQIYIAEVHGKGCWIVLEGSKSRHANEQPGIDVSAISLKEQEEKNLEKILFDPHIIPSNSNFNYICSYICVYMRTIQKKSIADTYICFNYICICEVCPKDIHPCNRKKQRHVLKKIQETRNIVHRTTMPQSPSKQAPGDLTQFSQLRSAAPCIFLNLMDHLKSLPFQW